MSTKENPMEDVLSGRGLTIGYDGRTVSEHLDVRIPPGSFTAIIGPNACGKSTLLRALSRLLKPAAGHVFLQGKDIESYPTREVARRLALLPQSSTAPDGITVADLVARGRFPHQSLLRQWSDADQKAVYAAMEATGVQDLADRTVGELSGGQRQRVWLALVLAQDTPVLLLDEPTTFLDISHQLEVLRLCRTLHRTGNYTLVTVLHELGMAFRFADHVIAMKDGRIVAQGTPVEIATPELMKEIYGIDAVVISDPATGGPLVVPMEPGYPDTSATRSAAGVPASLTEGASA
ncbi:ABC transporter ATP-binding protein [Arthrobacter caoxuetaonis]|uniref:ABC transporter ATP-binding protein n=1 Tax=Arthrobacter caoxuetaonis TaxID=2886935 RepID=A0A9X1MDX7_9MICC|nr:ABC transporter ATP-binding protein [Arthrobacter caoxuetaonis]MCC3297996.1 ABC transporter ATP-binding protein [Arthrobacter caoxuetaonis]USQ57010.1 ABC transporter ATP-binding protein [Arthrobacter caoxuetaonis]